MELVANVLKNVLIPSPDIWHSNDAFLATFLTLLFVREWVCAKSGVFGVALIQCSCKSVHVFQLVYEKWKGSLNISEEIQMRLHGMYKMTTYTLALANWKFRHLCLPFLPTFSLRSEIRSRFRSNFQILRLRNLTKKAEKMEVRKTTRCGTSEEICNKRTKKESKQTHRFHRCDGCQSRN